MNDSNVTSSLKPFPAFPPTTPPPLAELITSSPVLLWISGHSQLLTGYYDIQFVLLSTLWATEDKDHALWNSKSWGLILYPYRMVRNLAWLDLSVDLVV